MIKVKTVYLNKNQQKEIRKIIEILRRWKLEELYGENIALIACESILNSNLKRTIKTIDNAGTEKRIVNSVGGRTILTLHDGERCGFSGDKSHIKIAHKNNHGVVIDGEEIIDEYITISSLSATGNLCYDAEIVRTVLPHIGFCPSISLKTISYQVRENEQIITASYQELDKAKVMK